MSLHGSIYPTPKVEFYRTTEQTPDPRDLAPGLTIQDVDALLRAHYAQGYHDGQAKAWVESRNQVSQERKKAAQEAEAALLQWMWPNVMHRVLGASERLAALLDAPKSTIANDRKSVEHAFGQLKSALHAFHQKRPSDG